METINPAQSQANSLQNAPVDPMDKISPVPEDAASTPQVQAQTPPAPPSNDEVENIKVEGTRSRGMLVPLLGILTVLLLLIGSGTFFALVAYGKVDINNRELERKISFAVQSIPYTPKTAEYLVYQTFEAQSDLKSAYFDASIALTGSESMAITGLGNSFDLVISGPIDFHDENNPEAEINIKMTPELDADFVAVNDKIFFKINEIPAVIKGFASGAGLSFDMFMNKWIFYDLKSLESDARATLDEDKDARDEEDLEKIKTAILNSEVLNKIEVSDVEVNGVAAYEMSLALTSDEYLDFVEEVARAVDPEAYSRQLAQTRTSETFEDLMIKTFVAKDTMHTMRSEISFRFKSGDLAIPSQVLGASTTKIDFFPSTYTQAVAPESEYMDVAIVVNGSRFNEDFEIAEPDGATPIETIVEQYTQQMMMQQEAMYGQELDSFDSSEYEGFDDPYTLDESEVFPTDEEDSGISPY